MGFCFYCTRDGATRRGCSFAAPATTRRALGCTAFRFAALTRFACLGSFKTFDRFDWFHPEKIDRALVERLVDLEFVDRGKNVLLKGGSGLGKALIAQNLAQAALAAGFTVRCSTLAAARADLLGQESMPAFRPLSAIYPRIMVDPEAKGPLDEGVKAAVARVRLPLAQEIALLRGRVETLQRRRSTPEK